MNFIIKTKIIEGTIPSYYLETFPKRYNEALLNGTTITKTQNVNKFQKPNLVFKKLLKMTIKFCSICGIEYEKAKNLIHLYSNHHQLETGRKAKTFQGKN